LQRGVAASFGHYPALKRENVIGGVRRQVVTSTLVCEVSVLLGEKPNEPRAEVLSVRRSEPAAGEILHGATGRAVRRYDTDPQIVDSPPGVLIRPSGRILGIR
jgi:hypothetical protein